MTEEEYTATMGRGTAAAALLANDTLIAAIAAVEADIWAEFKQLAPGATGLMVEAHARVRSLDSIPAKLRAWTDDAKMISADAERRAARRG